MGCHYMSRYLHSAASKCTHFHKNSHLTKDPQNPRHLVPYILPPYKMTDVPFHYVVDEVDLNRQLSEAQDKLVVLSFLLLGNTINDKVLGKVAVTRQKYKDSVILLVVDVARLGDIANKYEVSQIPWFIFYRNQAPVKAFHTISNYKILNTVREMIDVKTRTKTYVINEDDLNKRLAEAGGKLVVIAFLISDDESTERLSIDLEEIDTRNSDSVVVIKVDVDICKDIAKKYHIEGVPTFVFVKNRQKIEEFTGHDADRLNNFVNQHKPSTSKEKENVMNASAMRTGSKKKSSTNVREKSSTVTKPTNKANYNNINDSQ